MSNKTILPLGLVVFLLVMLVGYGLFLYSYRSSAIIMDSILPVRVTSENWHELEENGSPVVLETNYIDSVESQNTNFTEMSVSQIENDKASTTSGWKFLPKAEDAIAQARMMLGNDESAEVLDVRLLYYQEYLEIQGTTSDHYDDERLTSPVWVVALRSEKASFLPMFGDCCIGALFHFNANSGVNIGLTGILTADDESLRILRSLPDRVGTIPLQPIDSEPPEIKPTEVPLKPVFP